MGTQIRSMPSDSAAVQENRLDNAKGMSDAMKESVRKAAFTICQLKEEGRHEEAEKLSKMVAESMGQLTEPAENDEMRTRMTELGTTTKMIGEHLTTGILKDGQVQIEVLRESKGFLLKCLPMLETQLTMMQTRYSALPSEEQVKYVTILERAVDTTKLLSELLKLVEE